MGFRYGRYALIMAEVLLDGFGSHPACGAEPNKIVVALE